MPGIDDSREFRGLNIAVMTVTDSRTIETDTAGAALVDRLAAAGHALAARAIVKDEVDAIRERLHAWIDDPAVEVVLTTGGTGVTGRDVTPEAAEPLFEKPIPGFGELFRMLSYKTIGTSTIQSRATAGVAAGTYIFCLPGSPSACRDAWDLILKDQLDIRHRPCNFAELMPRLQER